MKYFFERTCIYGAIGLGFTIPIATALDSLMALLILLGGLLSGLFWKSRALLRNNKVAAAALLLLGLLLIGTLYGPAELSDGLRVLNKYSPLLLIFLLLPVFKNEKYRSYGINAFLGSMLLTLVLSYLIYFGVFEGTRFFVDRLPSNPVVFKLHITHGIFMAFASFILAVKALESGGKWRTVLLILASLAAFNVLFMVQGRTGYLVFGGLFLYLAIHHLGLRGLVIASLAIFLIAGSGYLLSSKLHDRVNLAVQEFSAWKPKQGHDETSSIGTRMDFYSTTLKIIQKHPLIGVGTGGFELAYKEEIKSTELAASRNPHNQFLLFATQIGMIGLCAFLLLLAIEWVTATKLGNNEALVIARGLVITYVVGCMFNSLLFDHSEGLLFSWLSALLFSGYQIDTEKIASKQ